MQMRNDIQNEATVEPEIESIQDPPKRHKGRPRIHPPKPPKIEKRSLYLEDPRAYFRKYYHERTKTVLICPTCECDFSCKGSLAHHVRYNKNCQIIKLQLQLDCERHCDCCAELWTRCTCWCPRCGKEYKYCKNNCHPSNQEGS